MSKLHAKTVKAALPKDKPYRMADGKGLTLLVHPNGSKYWQYRYTFRRKSKMMQLGVYPDMTLEAARTEHATYRTTLTAGTDPAFKRELDDLEEQQNQANTFGAIVDEWLEIRKEKILPATLKKNASQLNKHLLPYIGDRPINEIEPPELLAALRRIESQGLRDTTHHVRTLARQVFAFAVATGKAERNTANDIGTEALKPIKGGHHAAITDTKELGKLLADIEAYNGTHVVRMALMMAPLVFLRPSELRMAEWAEFDLDQALWTIPAERMKGRKGKKRPHTIPLSKQVLVILDQLHPVTGRTPYLFVGQGRGKTISDNTLNKAMRRMGYTSDQVTAQGFRATARTVMDEVLELRPEIVEAQLAHAVKDANGRAYNRTQYLDQRRELMQTWADYCDTLKAQARGQNVTPLKQSKTA